MIDFPELMLIDYFVFIPTLLLAFYTTFLFIIFMILTFYTLFRILKSIIVSKSVRKGFILAFESESKFANYLWRFLRIKTILTIVYSLFAILILVGILRKYIC